jgi:predicted nucleic acid-binding protein
MIIISDSSPLISLATIEKLNLLDKLFTEIFVPCSVYEEVIRENKPYSNEIKEFLNGRIKHVKNRVAVEVLLSDIGKGESEAIILAIEEKSDYLLIDDLKARKLAKINGLEIIGTMGILLKGKKEGLIKEIKPFIDELLKNDIRIGDKIIEMTLKAAQE